MYDRQFKHDPAALLEELGNISLDPPDPRFTQRAELVAIVLREGKSPAQVAKDSNYSKRSIQAWVSAVDEKGWDALKSAPATGHPNRLSAEQLDEVKQAVLGDPKNKGYHAWTGETLAEYIRNTYHIEYCASAATKLMVRLGLRSVLNTRAGRTPVKTSQTGSSSGAPNSGANTKGQLCSGVRRKQYTSDINRRQYRLIQSLLESVTKRKIDLYDHFCGVLYILTTGAQWENLPGDFPPSKTVYHYFHLWATTGVGGVSIFTQCLIKLRNLFRNNMGKKNKLTLGIIDAKSVKNVDTAREKGYDAGKKVSGVKVHIVTDTLGLPHALLVTRANKTDRNGALEMVALNLDNLSEVKKFLVDGGYTGKPFADKIAALLPNAKVEVVKRNELHKFKVLPMRWIVERSFGWLEKYRRLWKNCEKSLEMTLQMTILAYVAVLLKRF